jgi:hypothetical protein
VIQHLGSAHTDAELAALMQIGRSKIEEGQGVLDLYLGLGSGQGPARAMVQAQSSRLLVDTAGRRSPVAPGPPGASAYGPAAAEAGRSVIWGLARLG